MQRAHLTSHSAGHSLSRKHGEPHKHRRLRRFKSKMWTLIHQRHSLQYWMRKQKFLENPKTQRSRSF